MRSIRLHRDRQQWIFDWLVKETGRVFHWDQEGRGDLPASVKSHRMIGKHLGKQALCQERIAREEGEAGHTETAMDFYFMATNTFAAAQHPIMEDDNVEKIFLHGRFLACYDKVTQYAPHPIERVYDLFDRVTAPKELWAFEDQHHMATLFGARNIGQMDTHMLALDWLQDAMAGKFGPSHARRLYLQVGGGGPNGKDVSTRSALRWWEESGK